MYYYYISIWVAMALCRLQCSCHVQCSGKAYEHNNSKRDYHYICFSIHILIVLHLQLSTPYMYISASTCMSLLVYPCTEKLLLKKKRYPAPPLSHPLLLLELRVLGSTTMKSLSFLAQAIPVLSLQVENHFIFNFRYNTIHQTALWGELLWGGTGCPRKESSMCTTHTQS